MKNNQQEQPVVASQELPSTNGVTHSVADWNKMCGFVALVLFLAQLMLILISWIVSAAAPELPVNSLLSGEGIRWLLRLFGNRMNSPLLLWLVLCAIAYGTFRDSGLWTTLRQRFVHAPHTVPLDFRQRLALRFVCVELLVFLVVILLLTTIPHALLVSVTGELFPSSFSQCLIPVLAFVVTVCSLSYGFINGQLTHLAGIYRALTSGVTSFAWLFPLYILASQLYHSVLFVFFYSSSVIASS